MNIELNGVFIIYVALFIFFVFHQHIFNWIETQIQYRKERLSLLKDINRNLERIEAKLKQQ